MNDASFSSLKTYPKTGKGGIFVNIAYQLVYLKGNVGKTCQQKFYYRIPPHPCTTKRFIIVLAKLVINGNFIALHGDFQIIPSFYITIMLFSHCVSASVFNLISRSATVFITQSIIVNNVSFVFNVFDCADFKD